MDLALACALPPWAWFLVWRWTGKAHGPISFAKFWWRAAKFIVTHLLHTGEGTGAFNVDWFSEPVRGCQQPENPGYEPKGSCGTCKNCCTTNWLPEAKRLSCPLLAEKGCSVYGGVYWDYFNCGRYPATPNVVAAYNCPRFAWLDEPAVGQRGKKLPVAAPAPAPEREPALPVAAFTPLPLAPSR